MKKIIRWKNRTAKKEHLSLLINNKKVDATDYNKDNNFEVGDYINHFKFGLGFVQNIINKSKIEVFFEDSERVMLQNWAKN